jgi:hypothetical protein
MEGNALLLLFAISMSSACAWMILSRSRLVLLPLKRLKSASSAPLWCSGCDKGRAGTLCVLLRSTTGTLGLLALA